MIGSFYYNGVEQLSRLDDHQIKTEGSNESLEKSVINRISDGSIVDQ